MSCTRRGVQHLQHPYLKRVDNSHEESAGSCKSRVSICYLNRFVGRYARGTERMYVVSLHPSTRTISLQCSDRM